MILITRVRGIGPVIMVITIRATTVIMGTMMTVTMQAVEAVIPVITDQGRAGKTGLPVLRMV